MMYARESNDVCMLLRKSSTKIGVIRAGFEPATHSLEGCCSIQLSYQTKPFSPFYGGKISKRGAKLLLFFEISKFFCYFSCIIEKKVVILQAFLDSGIMRVRKNAQKRDKKEQRKGRKKSNETLKDYKIDHQP